MNNKLEILRTDFPMLKQRINSHPLIYLDSAATTLKPQIVIDELLKFYQQEYGTVHRAIYTLAASATHKYNLVREKVQKFINASSSSEIIFTKGTTESINLVADCFGRAFVQPGDEILIGQLEHHSNIVPWQLMAEKRNAKIISVPADDNGDYCLKSLENLITDKTRLISIAHISNSIGTVHPIKEIIKIARKKNVKVFIDAAQSAARIPIDVQNLDADFLAFSGHKIYGPTGIGILYGKAEILEKMPPYQGGGDMIEKVDFAGTSFAKIPSRFEAGTPMIAAVLGLGTALDYVNQVGLDFINKHEEKLLNYLYQELTRIPQIKIIGSPKIRQGILSFIIPSIHAMDLATFLDSKGVAIRSGHHCSQTTMAHFGITSSLRVSFGIYNTEEEVRQFIEILKLTISIFS